MNTVEAEYELGTLWQEPDGAVYKYAKLDFGIVGTDTETNEDFCHIEYVWVPWNGVAGLKGIRTTMENEK